MNAKLTFVTSASLVEELRRRVELMQLPPGQVAKVDDYWIANSMVKRLVALMDRHHDTVSRILDEREAKAYASPVEAEEAAVRALEHGGLRQSLPEPGPQSADPSLAAEALDDVLQELEARWSRVSEGMANSVIFAPRSNVVLQGMDYIESQRIFESILALAERIFDLLEATILPG